MYGRGEGPILLSHLLCNGDEDSLNSCPHMGFGEHMCYDSSIAGVICSNGIFDLIPLLLCTSAREEQFICIMLKLY